MKWEMDVILVKSAPILSTRLCDTLFDGLCSLYYCADDNTIGTSHSNVSILKSWLEKYTEIAIEWF